MGSGNWYRWNAKRTTGETKRIDVRYLARQGYLQHGKGWSLHWTCGGKPSGSIGGATNNNTIFLIYRAKEHGSTKWEEVTQPIALSYTACHFGGDRPWFRCPFCDRRVAVLYLGARARCRLCARMAYDSQNESALDRMFRKARKIRSRLQADESNIDAPILFKPKGMHQKTFDRLRAEAYALEGCGLRGLMGRVDSWRR